jgi:hypothetical protein
MTDAFGAVGRAWLAGQTLPADERDTIDAALRQINFLTDEIATIEHDLAEFVLTFPEGPVVADYWGGRNDHRRGVPRADRHCRGDINRFTSPNAS